MRDPVDVDDVQVVDDVVHDDSDGGEVVDDDVGADCTHVVSLLRLLSANPIRVPNPHVVVVGVMAQAVIMQSVEMAKDTQTARVSITIAALLCALL